MKRPLYYLLCAIACTSMVSATMPMAAIAEATQPQATAEQQAQADATGSDTGKAEDGTNANVTAGSAEDSAATSTDTSADNIENADAATPNSTAAAATATPHSIPPHANRPHPRRNPHHVTNPLRPLRNRKPKRRHLLRLVERCPPRGHPPAGTATTFHVTQTSGSSQAKARMDVPTYWDGGSQESVCDPSRQAWASYYSLRARARDRAQRIHVGPQFTCMELAKVPIPNQKW